MLLSNLVIPLLATSATVSANFDVTSSLTKYASFDFGLGDISIQEGASFSLVNTFDCAFQGDISIEKDCEFVIASTAKALKLTFNNIFHKIENKGKWIVHTLEAAAASTCNIIVQSFVNTGEIILAFKGHVLAPIINIAANHWVNHGCLHIFQEIKSISVAILGVVGGEIENHGTICLTNQLCKQVTKISGGGCIALEKSSSFYISNSFLSIDAQHTFYLGAGNPTIQAQAVSLPQTFKVANFGANGAHKIGLNLPLLSISIAGKKGWSYDTKTGILTLTANGFISQKFDIGLGYDVSKFEVCTDDSVGIVSVINGSIKYNGPCPHAGRPSVCQVCPGVPTPPVITSSATAITSTQSKTASSSTSKVATTSTASSSTSKVATTSTASKPKPTTLSTSSIASTKTTASSKTNSVASTTTPEGSYSTSFVTATAETTKVVTITSCSNNACHPTTAPTGITVVTLTTSDIKTVVTTYCPLTQTVTLGVTGSKTVDLGCPTGYFGYNGYIGKGISFGHDGVAASASAGFQIGFDIFNDH